MAGEDKAYAAWIRSRPCMACGAPPPSNLHHRTGAGMGLRAPDSEGMPLCGSGTTGCHGSLHNPYDLQMKDGHFYGWDRGKIRDWQRVAIDILQSEWLSEKMQQAPQGAEEVF